MDVDWRRVPFEAVNLITGAKARFFQLELWMVSSGTLTRDGGEFAANLWAGENDCPLFCLLSMPLTTALFLPSHLTSCGSLCRFPE